MRTQNITIDHKIPGIVYGEPSEWVYLYVHGKRGCKEEALPFAEQADAMGYQVMAIDLPEHGERKNGEEKLLPWIAVPEIQAAYTYAARRWKHVCLYAVSIGAWLSLEALQQADLERVLLVSPVVDMEALITSMMQWANVTEPQLKEAGEIPTDFGETLSWLYLCWVREHPYQWNAPTEVLYGDQDDLTPYHAIERFRQKCGAHLTIVEGGAHWFHTPLQLVVLREWEKGNL